MIRSRHLADGESRLIFAWKDRYHRKLRLAFFLIIALALHVFCFYLFQVEYPKAERRLPYTAQLTVLNPRDTLTQVALRQIDDRTVSIDSAAREALKDAQIEDFATVFKPFFQDYEARLKEPPPIFQVTPVSDLVEAGTAVLPPAPSLSAPPAVEIASPPYVRHPHLTIRGGELEKRDLLHAIDWSAHQESFETSNGFSAASFMIAVDADGLVRHCLSTEGEESAILSMLHQKVSALRFQPSPIRALQWGWVDLKW